WALIVCCHRRSPSAGKRRPETVEEQPRDQQPDPNYEPKQRDDINRRQFADAFLPQLAHITEQPDRQERQQKEELPEDIGLAHGGVDGFQDRRAGGQADRERDQGGGEETPYAPGQALPDGGGAEGGAGRARFDVTGPQVGEDERPHANEDVDEDLDGGGGADHPTGAPLDAAGSGIAID